MAMQLFVPVQLIQNMTSRPILEAPTLGLLRVEQLQATEHSLKLVYPWDAIEVTWGAAGAGTVQVFETTSYGGVGTPTIFPVTINAQPATSALTGSTSVCANATMSYSVA